MAAPVVPPQTSFLQTIEVLVVNGGINLVEAIVILCLGWMGASWAKRWVAIGLAHLPLDLTLKPLIASLVRYVILIVTLVLVLGQFGVQTASLIAVLGAAGLAIGLAIQGTLSNVAAGVMLLILRPFRVGQFVEIAGGQQGTVREIGLFTTLITTRDMVYVSIPNSTIFGAVITNYTREQLRRVRFAVPVDRDNDLDKVEAVIVAALKANSHVVETPPPAAVVKELQEYTVAFEARAYVKSGSYWAALFSLRKEVQVALAKAQILNPVTRQAAVVRNEPVTDLTKVSSAPSEENGTGTATPDAAFPAGAPDGIVAPKPLRQ